MFMTNNYCTPNYANGFYPTVQTPTNPNQNLPSPTLNAAYMVNPIVTAPSSNNSTTTTNNDNSSVSSFSTMSTISLNAQPTFPVATPPAMMTPTGAIAPQSFQPLMQNVVCSPGPVVYDPRALQTAWTMPNMQAWQPVFLPQQPQMVSQTSFSSSSPVPVEPVDLPPQKQFYTNQKEVVARQRKSSRPRCKACCRNNSPKEVSIEDVREATAERPELMKQLPEFFGEPQLNFEEYVHYAPIFRVKSIDSEMQYFKIPRTTKERELNIPRRLCELFVRTFGPEDAPECKDFDRISPHNHLCDARMAIRNSIVKELPNFIIGCRNMEEANNIFDLIFRYAGVSMIKSICNNLPQVFTAVVEMKGDNESLCFECTGVVSLFNYHLFRRRIYNTNA